MFFGAEFWAKRVEKKSRNESSLIKIVKEIINNTIITESCLKPASIAGNVTGQLDSRFLWPPVGDIHPRFRPSQSQPKSKNKNKWKCSNISDDETK